MKRCPPLLPTDEQTASRTLLLYYKEEAGAEALLRAFLAERDCDKEKARFWVEVYGMVGNK